MGPEQTHAMSTPESVPQTLPVSPIHIQVDEATGFVTDRDTKEVFGRVLGSGQIRALCEEDKPLLDKHGYKYRDEAFQPTTKDRMPTSDRVSLGSPISDYQGGVELELDDRELTESELQHVDLDTGARDEIVDRASKMVADILLTERRADRKEWVETRARWRDERGARLRSRQAATAEINQKLIPLLESQVATAQRLVWRAEELTNWVAISTIWKGVGAVALLVWLWRDWHRPGSAR
jgi:hypothetical protein